MNKNYETKLWGGRFRGGEDDLMEQFQNCFVQTLWLLAPDIEGSLAHVAMQVQVGLLTAAEGQQMTQGLTQMLADWHAGTLDIAGEYEDVHTYVEIELGRRIGPVAKKLHTARSRNDQVNLDMKLYVRSETQNTLRMLESLTQTLTTVADANPWLMPGYTHVQRAQVITFKYYLLAYRAMFVRDVHRLQNALQVMDASPLGCGALAGTTHQIDRQFTAEKLGFSKVYDNFLDGVSDRDFVLEVMSCFSIMMVHLSRMAEELIYFGSAEFGFITLDDKYTTGSSIMPQKKNADGAELVRGRAGRVFGDLMAMLTTMKGLPLAYNKDMQEDKDLFHEALITTQQCVQMTDRMVATLKAHPDTMRKSVKTGFLNATEVADYLVDKGVPFRDAHGIVGRIVIACEDKKCAIEDLPLEELQQFSSVFAEDIYPFIDYDNILQKGIKKEML